MSRFVPANIRVVQNLGSAHLRIVDILLMMTSKARLIDRARWRLDALLSGFCNIASLVIWPGYRYKFPVPFCRSLPAMVAAASLWRTALCHTSSCQSVWTRLESRPPSLHLKRNNIRITASNVPVSELLLSNGDKPLGLRTFCSAWWLLLIHIINMDIVATIFIFSLRVSRLHGISITLTDCFVPYQIILPVLCLTRLGSDFF